MSTALTILIAVLVFGFLIFIHEFGHYITARIFKVSITEFSIGMGPRLVWYDSKKTGIRYSLSMLPIGGFVAMVGEDGESDDPNSFDKKPAWQRFIITAAGAAVNILAGVLAMILLTSLVTIGDTTVGEFIPSEDFAEIENVDLTYSSADFGLMEGDTIIKVNGKSVRIYDELSYQIMRYGNEPVDLTVIRGTEEMELKGVRFPTITEEGQTFGLADIRVHRVEKGFFNTLTISVRKSALVIRMVWESLYDLITGRYSFAAVSGPVGISGAIGDAARTGFASLLNITVIISINLGVMNLLPIPALDGGRLLSIIIEMITKKKLPAKIEGAINGIGLLLLLGLSLVIMVKDVVQLF